MEEYKLTNSTTQAITIYKEFKNPELIPPVRSPTELPNLLYQTALRFWALDYSKLRWIQEMDRRN